ncbi:MAG: GDSL-type esterase/lipase family protein, partial [Pseudomonadota bacterium]
SNVNFTNNVTHNLVGAAYYTEAGDEIGSFIGNLAMRTVNPTFPLETGEPVENSIADNGIPQRSSFLGEEGVGAPTDPGGRELRQDYGFQGDGFWFHGPNVQVENNVVSGASGHAYIWWAEGLIERFPDGSVRQATHDTANVPGGDLIGPDGTRLQVYDTPIGSFVGNEGYSATVGLQFFYFQTEVFGDGVNVNAGVPVPPAAYDAQLRSTLSDVTIWNVEKKGLDAPYVNRVTLENSTFIGAGDPASVGIDLDHPHTARGWELRNVTVEDFGIGLQAPRQGDFLLDGGTFANLTDVEISEVQRGARDLTFRDLTLAPLANALSGQEAGRTNYDLAFSSNVDPEVRRTEWDPLWFLQPDRIVVETTGGERVGLFFPNQSADYIPVPVGDPLAAALPAEVVGLTNQQLWDQYGLSFGGGILPDDAARGTSGPTGVFTDGFVGSPLPAPVLYPPFAEFNPDDINAPIGYVDEGRNFAVETGFQPRAAASSDPTPPPPSSGSPTPMPPAPIPTPNPSSPVDSGTIGFVGDSITARAADEAFITYLASSYSDTRFQAAAVGSAGVTSQAGNRIQDSPEYQQLLASDASLVWLMIGGNDILGGASLSEYRAGLEAVIAELKAMPSAPQIVIAAQPPFFDAEPEAHAIFRAEWIPAMQAIAAAQGAGFVDVNAAVTDYPTNYPDDIHPNATAAANLATIIGEALEGLGVLGDGAPPPLQDLPPPPAAGDPDMPDEDNVPDDGAPAMPIDDATLAKLYIVFYGRMPDTPGFEHWSGVAEARPDLGLMDFASLFATAAEFDALYGSLSAAEIVTSFYRQVLGRDPEPEGLSHWTGVLEDDPDTGLMALALGFVTADETDQIHGAAIEAFLATPTSEASGDVLTFPVTFEVIADFDAATDRIDISGRGTAADVEVLDEPEGSTLLLDGGDLFLPGVDAEDITTDSFIF